jgi:transcriptional regulator
MKKKEWIREKYWDDRRPRYDLDFVEVHVSPAELEIFLKEHEERFSKSNVLDESFLIDRKRRDQMSEDIYKAAASCLTDLQFQIFILRYKFGLLENEIARQSKVTQPYVSDALLVCYRKIRIALKLEAKSKRNPRNPSKGKSKKKASKQAKRPHRRYPKNP